MGRARVRLFMVVPLMQEMVKYYETIDSHIIYDMLS